MTDANLMPLDLFQAMKAEAVDLLRDLIRTDTTNPPGNEKPAAEILARYLGQAGIESQVLEAAPGRSNLVARLRGSGGGAPLLLLGHLDVVPAEPDKWTHPPFAGEIHDGYLFGRGAVDMKNHVAMSATVLKALKVGRVKLARDVVFAAVADEETGCALGSQFLVEKHPDLIRAEHMLGEAGGMNIPIAGRAFYPIQVAERGIAWMHMSVSGPPGHGSIPRQDSAVVKLAQAVASLGTTRLPIHVTPPAAAFVDGLAASLPIPMAQAIRLLKNPAIANRLLGVLPRKQAAAFASCLANTVSPTGLRAGKKINVITGEATVDLDGRLVPGQTADDLVREIEAVVGKGFRFDVFHTRPATVSPHSTPLYRRMEATLRRHDPEAIPVPFMVSGFTDASCVARLGTTCYGFSPAYFDPKEKVDFASLAHGHDERIPVEGFQWGLGVLYDVVSGFCAE
jgi:acetylornithine deacetylase/succinyl-diaminopimelate desuccinylase-like protein